MRQVMAAGRVRAAYERGKAAPRRPATPSRWQRLGEIGSRVLAAANVALFRRPMLVLTVALIVGGGLFGIISGGYVSRLIGSVDAGIDGWLAQAGFAIREVKLAGNERTPADAVRATLEIAEGQSIFALSPADARARLLELPWVADAEVRRTFPGTVSIRLVEKRPFALWRTGNAVAVIERSGGVITAADADSFAGLALFAGEGAPEAAAPFLDALRSYRATAARVQTIQRIGARRWDLLLAGGVTVKLPETGWETQLAELENLIVEKAILERDIETIDLRYPDNFVFRLHNDSRPVIRERRA